jgi:hypothetical protein
LMKARWAANRRAREVSPRAGPGTGKRTLRHS